MWKCEYRESRLSAVARECGGGEVFSRVGARAYGISIIFIIQCSGVVLVAEVELHGPACIKRK